MSARLMRLCRTDATLLGRNHLYAISVGVSAVMGGALGLLAGVSTFGAMLPAALLLVAGGSTLLYVVGMVALERADGTLSAISVSPVRVWEYVLAKVMTLGALATLEGVIISMGVWGWLSAREGMAWFGVWEVAVLLCGLTMLGSMHVMIGLILIVRHEQFMSALMPMGVIAIVLQVPAFWFVGALDTAAVLVIPTAAPTMLIQGALRPLATWEWTYAMSYTAISMGALWWWCQGAFERHVTQRAGG